MRYWKIQFNDREFQNQYGWLEINDAENSNRIFQDDGTLIEEGISYTAVDVEPTPPSWSVV